MFYTSLHSWIINITNRTSKFIICNIWLYYIHNHIHTSLLFYLFFIRCLLSNKALQYSPVLRLCITIIIFILWSATLYIYFYLISISVQAVYTTSSYNINIKRHNNKNPSWKLLNTSALERKIQNWENPVFTKSFHAIC